MAKKKPFDIKNVMFAAGGGAAAGVLTNAIESKITFFADRPKMTPAFIAALSAAGIYFMDDEYHALFYGMLGASGADLGSQVIENASEKMATDLTKEVDILDTDPTLINVPGTMELPATFEQPLFDDAALFS